MKDPIAIVGFSAKLPQDATSAEAFWQLLSEGRSARTEIPKDRFNIDSLYHPDLERLDTIPVRHGHFLSGDLAAFDAPFFSIQPTEALSMDPQQRLLLETSYRALENAGIPMSSIAGSKTGVFVGQSSRDYETLLLRDPDQAAKYVGTGIGTSMMANRISWFFDLRGPSVALDTACSSSLVAFHMACQSLTSGETDVGLVGGTNVIFAPDLLVHLSTMGFLNPDGICYTFDARGNGYGKGEGVCIMIIKRLSDALRDGDCIRAVVRATATNQDGRTPGLTVPSQRAQAENIMNTYKSAGLDMDVTALFESHGTGTQVGDVLETGAINDAFGRGGKSPLYVGALKPNIGHLESASGLAAIIKAVLTLEHGMIPPNIWFEKLNPSILADKWNLRFPLELTPWPKAGVRRISLNSFGYGGANAHVVMDDAFHYLTERGIQGYHHTNPVPDAHIYKGSCRTMSEVNGGDSMEEREPKVLVWSAFDESGIARLKSDFQTYLDKNETIRSSLRRNLGSEMSKAVRASTKPTLLFVFTGQGAVWYAMGRELNCYPVFHSSLRRSEAALQDLGCKWSLIAELHRSKETSSANTPALSQPLCTAIQLALVDLLASWGVRPSGVVGHSSGEIAAAYCAGALSLESSMKAAYARGILASILANDKTFNGAMSSVALPEEAIGPYMDQVMKGGKNGRISVGCVNSPKNVTITGDSWCIDALNSIMSAEGVFARKLAVDVAYHSHHMESVAEEYLEKLGDLEGRRESAQPSILMFSSVTGKDIDFEQLRQGKYWVDNLVSKVRFSEALTNALLHTSSSSLPGSATVILELGPHSALQRPVKDTAQSVTEKEPIFYDCILSRDTSAMKTCLGSIGRLFCRGYPVNIDQVNMPTSQPCSPLVDLPEYPFNHTQTYWQESRISRNHRFREHPRHELLGTRSMDWNQAEPKWRNALRVKELTWIQDHKMDNTILFPAGGVIILAIEGLRQLIGSSLRVRGWVLKNVRFLKALLISTETAGTETQFHLFPKRHIGSVPVECEFVLYSWSESDWSRVCDGTIAVDGGDPQFDDQAEVSETFKTGVHQCCDAIEPKQFYHNIADYGYHFGPRLQKIRSLKYSDDCMATAKIKLEKDPNQGVALQQSFVLHPTDLEGVLQLGIASVSGGSWANIPLFVPTKLQRLWIANEISESSDAALFDALSRLTFKGYRDADFSFIAVDNSQTPIITADGYRLTATGEASASARASNIKKMCYRLEWKPDIQFLSEAEIERLMVEKATAIRANLAEDETLVGSSMVAAYLDVIAHKFPGLEMLELKAGTGASTKNIVTVLTSSDGINGTARFGQYTCTEMPSIFTEALSKRFSENPVSLESKSLDIEKDIETQGFVAQQYDVVVCCSTIQPGTNLAETLRHTRKLLKTGGTLILFEPISPEDSNAMLNHEVSCHNKETESQLDNVDPVLSITDWTKTLKTCGFSTQGFYRSSIRGASDQPRGLLVSNAVEFAEGVNGISSSRQSCYIVADQESTSQREIALAIAAATDIPEENIVVMEQLPALASENTCLIFLPETERPVFENTSLGEYQVFQEATKSATSIIWVTKGCSEIVTRPEFGIINGLGRVIGSENWDLKFVQLALEEHSSVPDCSRHICSVLEKVMSGDVLCPDTEFREIDGMIHIGRIIETPELNGILHKKLTPTPAVMTEWEDAHQPLKLTVGITGNFESLHFSDDWMYDKPLGDKDVEIQVAASSICPRDVMIVLGELPGNTLGLECSGIVSRAGNLSGYLPGQRVCCFTTDGALGTFVRSHSSAVLTIPESMSFGDAASIPVALFSAFYGLVTLGRLEAGQSVLIHSGAGRVGQFAIQIAQRLKANIFTTVGSDDERELLVKQFGIDAHQIFSNHDTSFGPNLRRMIGGPDVVMNSLSGEGFRESWSCIAPMGRFIALGNIDQISSDSISTEPFARNATFAPLDIASIYSQDKHIMAQNMTRAINMFQDGEMSLRCVEPLRRFSVSEIQDGFRYVREGKRDGAAVIEMKGSAIVPIAPTRRSAYRFDSNATYAIAGGLGGLGRCITRWMVGQGARNFLMLSRSGAASSVAREFMDEMMTEGINIQAPLCDITNGQRVLSVLEEYKQRMPPIKGCIQATMILKSNLFPNMTHGDFVTGLAPKVQGSWNLHRYLPSDLDFFVLLSSISGIAGSRSTANYASGSTYKDALARYRVSLGQKAVSLDLGSIMGVGVVAEADLFDLMTREGFQGVTKTELLALIELACDPAQPLVHGRIGHSQLVTGLGYAETLSPQRLQEIYWARKPMFSVLRQISASKMAGTGSKTRDSVTVDYTAMIKAAKSDTDAIGIILDALVSKLSRLLFVEQDNIDPSLPIHAFGIDSLVGTEIRYWFTTEFHVDMAIFEILDAKSLYLLAGAALGKLSR
ncbi:putative polyketide synthase [Annulohypoxylon truncatum]|uniref:putative polyketide synthase n=1 Tax=Annulohypoxylon truncatum TaxID=327061 RepID=UPI002007D0FC|nr:putative polyketide synthase [Annulohypoxylon truncatum]KAI1208477.1 putative polyketide synthase [Annulohypoxylon truncatum]